MTDKKTRYVPDASGTVVVKGFEEQAAKLKLDLTYFKKLKTDTEEGKEEFRRLADGIIRTSGPGASRVLFRSSNGDGIKCSAVDPQKDGNRPDFSEETWKKIQEAGGLDEVEELVDRREVVTLTGKWAAWFLGQLKAFAEAGQVDIDQAYESGEVQLANKAKLKPGAGEKLLGILADGGEAQRELATLLLRKGFKAMSVS